MKPIILTEAALAHLHKIMTKRGKGIGMRLSVKTTGCSGLSYVVDIADEAKPDDHVFTQSDGAKVLVDAKSYPFIEGVQVDYVKTGLNENFQFTNPNAEGICGCGESFNVAKGEK